MEGNYLDGLGFVTYNDIQYSYGFALAFEINSLFQLQEY